MSEPLLIGLSGLGFLFALIAFRIPIAYAMMLVGGVGVSILNGPAIFMSQLKTLAYGQFSIYDLSVVPMFVPMGNLATRAELSGDLFRAANAWLGRFRGGVAMATVAACAGFGSVCGSSLATGTVAAGGVPGILIPPSVVLVIYAIIVEANIVTMFKAALIPGLIAVLFFMVTISIFVAVKPESGRRGDPVDRAEFISATLKLIPVLVIFGLVIGGIYFGFFNPTPAAAIGVFLVWLYGTARGLLGLRALCEALLDTARTTGMIYLILLGAEMVKIFMSRGGVPQAMAEWMLNSGLSAMTILGICWSP